MPTKKKTISVRLDPKLARRLEKLARNSERSVSWHVARFVEENIERVEKEVAAINVGLEDIMAGRVRDADEVIAELRADLERRGRGRERKAG